mgnify:CR=1 FL=1
MIKRYSSRREPLSDSLFNKNLKNARDYDRIAGYFNSSILEIAGEYVDDMDKPVEWVNYQTYLLSSKQADGVTTRHADQTPLTTPIAKPTDIVPYNFRQKYAALVGMDLPPIQGKKPKEKKKAAPAPAATNESIFGFNLIICKVPFIKYDLFSTAIINVRTSRIDRYNMMFADKKPGIGILIIGPIDKYINMARIITDRIILTLIFFSSSMYSSPFLMP